MLSTLLNRMRRAVAKVIPHELSADSAQGFLHSTHLAKNVSTVTILFDHLLNAANLPLDSLKPDQVLSLDVRQYCQRLSLPVAPRNTFALTFCQLHLPISLSLRSKPNALRE
jgi:hypothetical protein